MAVSQASSGRESVVDVHLDVVAVSAEVSALSDPIDQPGGQQEPLELGGAVVEIERQLRHPRLGIVGGRRCPGAGRCRPGRRRRYCL